MNWKMLPSLKLTAKAPGHWPFAPKGKEVVVFQPLIFRGKLAVSFREGIAWVEALALLPTTTPRIHLWYICLHLVLTLIVSVDKIMYHTWISWDPLPNEWDPHGISS